MSAYAVSLKSALSVADSELVVRAIAGREECFEELVRRYQRPIAAYVYRMIGDYDTALDLTQEVFIRVYGSLARYRSEYKFSTWIYRIAHNAAIDHLRRCDNSRTEDLKLESDGGQTYEKPLASGAPSPQQESEREELPADFTRVVKARAQTDMSGVRAPRERTISLKICLALACAIFALLGAPAID